MKKKYLVGVIVSVIFLFIVFNLSSDHKETEELYKEINESYCNEMKTPEMKKTCIAIIGKNFSTCESCLNFREVCYKVVSQLAYNISFCDKAPPTAKYWCYRNLAVNKKNVSICEKLEIKDECYRDLAIQLHNTSLCKKMNADCEKNQCLAEVTGNASYCEKVPDVGEKELCFKKIANDIDACKVSVSEYGELEYEPYCMHIIAKQTNNISICWKIKSGKHKLKCLAELSKDKRVCNESESQFWKDFCLVEILKNKLVERKD